VILVSVAGLVLWGTLSPLVYELWDIGKISVGPPVFAVMFLVPMLPLMVFLAIGMHSAWRRGKLTACGEAALVAARRGARWRLRSRARVRHVPLGRAGRLQLRLLDHFLRAARAGARWRQGQKLAAGVLGMAIAHFGVGMFAIGASGVESYKIEKDVALKPGGSF
jgi:cytochrome c-type biogenesis protein CcmF